MIYSGSGNEFPDSDPTHVNPNQRGMPATTKEGALEEKIQLAEGAGFSLQKRLTLKAR